MQHHLYPDHWKQPSQACLEQAGYRCEGCGIPHGSLRVGKHHYNLYVVHLHAAHITHDPQNLEADLRALCPSCHKRHDRKTERQPVAARGQSYQMVSLTHLVTVERAAGLSIMPEGTGCAWQIGGLSEVASDVLDAIGSALHCLLMECMEVQA
jgi:hypothetical protein